MNKILVWKSYGNIDVYAINTPEQVRKIYDEIIEILSIGNFTYNGKQDLAALLHWINFHSIGDDWAAFEYIKVTKVQE